MKIKRSVYEDAVAVARAKGLAEGLTSGRAQAVEHLRVATEWRKRYETMAARVDDLQKGGGPEQKTLIEGSYARGQQHALMQIRGQLMEFLNGFNAS